MEQKLWRSMAYMGICFLLLAGGMEIYQWATARF